MKICFIGLGSIARRHIKNLRELFENVCIDVLHHSIEKKIYSNLGEEIIVNNHYFDPDDMPNDYDVIFITNPTNMHYDTLRNLHYKAKHFFIEKPVFMTGEEDIDQLHLRNDSIYYVACPLRYTNVLQYVKNNINFKNVYSIRCISSSYLPDWRPGVDYRETYSARKELGGGVELDLIHEWDYITWLLGYPTEIRMFIGKKSRLEMSSNDISIYIADYTDKMVEIHLDYFGRVPMRKLELIGAEDTVSIDLINQKIEWIRSKRILEMSQKRDEFQKKELVHFFDIIDGKQKNDNDIWEAKRLLGMVRGMH